MKKLNKFKIASMLAAFALTVTAYAKLPDSFLLWGEPSPTLDDSK